MDGELVSDSTSAIDNGGERDGSPPFDTYTKKFYELFPYYLSIGMTPEQYWEGDATWARAFRKAAQIQLEKKNHELWLQGMYFYEALCDASPLLHAFAKKGTKPHPYPDKPYAITDNQRERNEDRKEKATFEKGKKLMELFMQSTNSKFADKAQVDQ